LPLYWHDPRLSRGASREAPPASGKKNKLKGWKNVGTDCPAKGKKPSQTLDRGKGKVHKRTQSRPNEDSTSEVEIKDLRSKQNRKKRGGGGGAGTEEREKKKKNAPRIIEFDIGAKNEGE